MGKVWGCVNYGKEEEEEDDEKDRIKDLVYLQVRYLR